MNATYIAVEETAEWIRKSRRTIQPKGYEGYRVAWQDAIAPDWNAIGVEAAAEAVLEGVDVESPAGDDEATAADADDIPF